LRVVFHFTLIDRLSFRGDEEQKPLLII
jgi:hypothetical protein